jgi:MFS family permease
MAVVASALGSYALLQSVTVPTLPLIQRTLRASPATADWILVAFFLSSSIATPILGRIGDSYGRRRVFLVSLGMICVGAVVAALAPTIQVMIAARVIQGVGGGAIPLSFALIRDALPAAKVPGAIGLASSLIAVGYSGGIVIAGPVTSLVGLPGLFLLPALAATAAAVAARILIADTVQPTRAPVPILPGFLLAGWLATLLFGISEAPRRGWIDPTVVASGSLAVVLATAWVWLELRARVPLIDLRLLAGRGVWSVNLVSLLAGVVTNGLFGFLPQFAQTPTSSGYGFGATASEAGRMLLPTTTTNFLGGATTSWWHRVLGVRYTIFIGAGLSAIALTALSLIHHHPWQIYLITPFCGVGSALVFASVSSAVAQAVPTEHTGVATGMAANLRTIGGTVGTAVMATIVTAHTEPSGVPTEAGYEHGFQFLAVVSGLVALAAFTIPLARRTRRDGNGPVTEPPIDQEEAEAGRP